jgi:hypothetical protein
MSDYKYDVGDLVHVSIKVLDQLPKKNRKRVSSTFKSNLFIIAKRRKEPNQYFVPGYDWQGGDAWVDEAWLSKWAGSGPLRLAVTIDPEDSTDEEFTEKLHKVCEKLGKEHDDLIVTFEEVDTAAFN